MGLKKMKLSASLGCKRTDIVERYMVVETRKTARVIGKGGQNAMKLEKECGVIIDADKSEKLQWWGMDE
jgi:transcription antitermination factor NusA-like protein